MVPINSLDDAVPIEAYVPPVSSSENTLGSIRAHITGYIVIIGSALSGTVFGGEEPSRSTSDNDVPSAPATMDAEEDEGEGEMPQDIFSKLKELEKKYSSGITKPEQARDVVPVFRQYHFELGSDGYTPSIEELSAVAQLAIYGLYYRNSTRPDWEQGEARDLPLAILDVEAALIEQCRIIPEGNKKERKKEVKKRKELEGRLRTDILWHAYYNDSHDVWNSAAEHYCRLYLPEERQITIETFNGILSKLSKGHAISSRVVRNSYERIDDSLAEFLDKGDEADFNFEFIDELLKLQKLLTEYMPSDYKDAKSLSEEEIQEFNKWRNEKITKPLLSTTHRLITKPMSQKERSHLSRVIADEVLAEDAVEQILSQISRFGLTPYDAIVASPRPRKGKPNPYGVGPWSQLFIDTYRSSMGDPAFADPYIEDECGLEELPKRKESFRRNSASLFLETLNSVCKENNKDKDKEENFNELFLMSLHGMMEELRRMESVPDMEEWGQRAAFFVEFPGTFHGFHTADEWQKYKAKMLNGVLTTGFPELYPPVGKKPEQVPGLFTKLEKELPEHICRTYGIKGPERRNKVPGSPLHKEEIERGRQAFLTSFMEATPKIMNTKSILSSWGFTEEEISKAQEKE